MPLPPDEKLVATAQDVLGLFKQVFGSHPGFRPAHAKGILLTGKFTPTSEAAALSKAALFHSPSTPVEARFSNSTGIPQIPDNDSNAGPRGFAVRFNLPPKDGRRVHTDVLSHSTPHFPVHDGAEFGEFLKAIIASPAGTPSPSPVEKFIGSRPGVQAFVTAPKPFPVSFGTEQYFALNAFKFVAEDGKETWVRYSWLPVAGLEHLSDEEAKSKSADYLSEELKQRIPTAPISFKFLAQIADEGDPTDDVLKQWPEDRKKVELGTLELNGFVEQDAEEQKKLIFDPIPRIEGIEPSADPILEFRAALYLLSGRERRAA